jgi:hypothetical protein
VVRRVWLVLADRPSSLEQAGACIDFYAKQSVALFAQILAFDVLVAQEMSSLDEGFRKRLAKLFSGWCDGIAAALREGQKRGLVRSDVDPHERAIFLVAVYEGYVSLAKNSQDARVLQAGKRILIRHLESLRPCALRKRAPSSDQ